MNPYEAPQSSLDPEPPRLPLRPVQNALLDSIWIVGRALVLFGIIISGLLLAHHLANVLGFTNNPRTERAGVMLPFLVLIFLSCSWTLWKMRGPRSRRS